MATKRRPEDVAPIDAARRGVVLRLTRRGFSYRIAGAVVGWSGANVCRRLKRLSEGEKRKLEPVDLTAAT